MLKTNLNLNDKNIAIVTHRSLMPDIPGGDLKRFLNNNNCFFVTYLTHPLLLLEESKKLSSEAEFYKESRIIEKSTTKHWSLPEPFSYAKDFIYTIIWILKSNTKYDIFFGINNINALSGIFLKKIGRVKKVVYYTIDLYPQRFKSKLINFIYHKLDYFCTVNCDETWNVSPFIEKYRMKKWGLNKKRQHTVPIGIWFNEIKRSKKTDKNKIVYVGHLKDFYGVDLVIRSLPFIIKKIHTIKLEIIGGGEQMDELKKIASSLSINKYIKFHGWKEKKQSEHIMSDAALGLAPFNTLIIDEKVKNGDPAKIKDYLGLGLPVIMTDASINAQIINQSRCGLIIKYDEKSFSEAVVRLLSNKKLLKEYRVNALKFANQYDWSYIFTQNISRLL